MTTTSIQTRYRTVTGSGPDTPTARLFAVDLPGFGRSERRADLLSPRAMGDFLARLVVEADSSSASRWRPGSSTRTSTGTDGSTHTWS
jgi:pimeloyl-ACP methyl ester carboxylesterase